MAGLDTRGLLDGAIKGFSVVDRYYDKEDAKKRQAGLDQENSDYRTQQQDNWQDGQDESKRRRDQDVDYRTTQAKQSQENSNRSFGLQEKQFNNTVSNQAHQRNRQESADARAASEREKAQDLKDIQLAYSDAMQGVELSDKSLSLMKKYPNYNIAKYLNPQVSKSIDYFEQGAANIKSDDDMITFINTPQAREAFGAIYSEQVSKGDGKNKAVEMFVPVTKDGKKYVAVHLSVEGEDGVRYQAPITNSRSSKPDDNVKLIPIDQVQQQIQEMASINGALKRQDPKSRKRLEATMIAKGFMAKPAKASYEVVKLKDAMDEQKVAGSFNETTGEYKEFKPESSGLPSPAEHSGRVIVDTETGERMKSDGNKWLPIDS